jgi:hypothetical protein
MKRMKYWLVLLVLAAGCRTLPLPPPPPFLPPPPLPGLPHPRLPAATPTNRKRNEKHHLKRVTGWEGREAGSASLSLASGFPIHYLGCHAAS